MRVHGAFQHVVVEAERPVDDLAPGEDPARLAGQHLQDAELLGGEPDRPAGHPYLEPAGVDLQVADPLDHDVGVLHHAGAAQQRPGPGHQFPRAVRLGQVVVRADVQAEQDVLLGAARGQHQHRYVRLGAQDPAHVQPVDHRHHHVQDHQVRPAGPGPVQGGTTVPDDQHPVALALQVQPDQVGLLRVVLGDQHPCAHRFHPALSVGGDLTAGAVKNR
ncbi:hypothetical protein GCM10027605_45710 [Micromonospora zhanjiangensis]